MPALPSPSLERPARRRRAARPADRLTLVDLRLPARSSALKGAREAVAAAATEFGLDAKRRYEFVFAVNEAVTNAIKHGSPYDDGAVGLRLDAAGDELICSVSDAGPFRHRSSAPRADGGRGIPFMRMLSDRFDLLIETDHTTVRLTKLRLADSRGAEN